jgi:hypothetical protein
VAAHGSCFEHAFRLQEEAPPLPVESAFNGLGLYKAAALRGAASRCAYLGLTQGHAVSEHVPFHLCLGSHAHARLAIMPGLTTHCAPPKIEKAPRRFVTWRRSGSIAVRAVPMLAYELRRAPLSVDASTAARAGGWVSWRRTCPGSRGGSPPAPKPAQGCWAMHQQASLKEAEAAPPNTTLRQRCRLRHATWASASQACAAWPQCGGVTRDAGMRCEIVDD